MQKDWVPELRLVGSEGFWVKGNEIESEPVIRLVEHKSFEEEIDFDVSIVGMLSVLDKIKWRRKWQPVSEKRGFHQIKFKLIDIVRVGKEDEVPDNKKVPTPKTEDIVYFLAKRGYRFATAKELAYVIINGSAMSIYGKRIIVAPGSFFEFSRRVYSAEKKEEEIFSTSLVLAFWNLGFYHGFEAIPLFFSPLVSILVVCGE